MRILVDVLLTKRWSLFLLLAGAFNVVVWPRFAVAIWNDPRSFTDSGPTAFLWVHAVLIVSATLIGLVVALVGVRGLMAGRKARAVSGMSASRIGQ